MTKDLLSEIEKRRDAGDDPCDSCNATGLWEDGAVCTHCLGQKVLLTGEEYNAILLMSGYHNEDDSILDRSDFDYPQER